jgi:OmpW family
MDVSKWRTLVCAWICCAIAPAVLADGASDELRPSADISVHSRLHDLLARQLRHVRSHTPAWIRELSFGRIDPTGSPGDDRLQLVLQQHRPDGTDLLTLRYPLAQSGAMSAYAGAGLNQTVFYGDSLVVPDPLYQRSRSRSIGAAAELGAEYRASERLLVGASLRWAELDAQAVQLASDGGMVGADELSAGVSLGWRFR